MKIESNNSEVFSNVNNSHQFTIQNNAKMFQILSSKIYTYKIAAIVREISCNAYDSHIEAGIPDKPFRVVIPNYLHEYFEIEDFGVGLDENQVYDIYTSYGASTKGHTNDLIGAFGLGSKTPFAYTNSFTIRTRKDGVEYLFNAYIGQDGAPTCSLLSKKDTEECNGVKIKIPVKSHHVSLFKAECQFILSFFPTRPEVVADNFEFIYDEEKIKKIDEGGIVTADRQYIASELYSGHTLYAVMGHVCYPISSTDLMSHGDVTLSNGAAKYMRDVIVGARNERVAFLKFDIGDLETTASREALSIEHGKKTQQVLVEKFEKEIRNKIVEDQTYINSLDHVCKVFKYLKDQYGDIAYMMRGLYDYNGKSLDGLLNKRFSSPYGESGFIKDSVGWGKSRALRASFHPAEFVNGYAIINAADKKTKGFVKHARELIMARAHKAVIITNGNWSEHKINRYIKYVGIAPDEIYTLEDLKIPVGSPVQRRASGLPKKKKEEVQAISYRIVDGIYCDVGSERIDVEHYRNIGYDVYYIDREENYRDGDIRIHTKMVNVNHNTSMFVKWLNNNNIIIINKNKTNAKSVEYNEVMSLEDKISEIIENNKDLVHKMAQITAYIDLDGHSNIYNETIPNLIKCGSSLIPSTVIDMYNEICVGDDDRLKDCRFTDMLIDVYKFDNEVDDLFDRDAIIDKADKHYPALSYFNRYANSDIIGEYIKSMDELEYLRKLTKYQAA